MAYDDIGFWKDQAKEFTQKTGIDIKYEAIPFPAVHDKFLASFMSGSKEYDVVTCAMTMSSSGGPEDGWSL